MLAAHDGADFFGLFGVAFFVEVLGDKLGVFEHVLNLEVGIVLRKCQVSVFLVSNSGFNLKVSSVLRKIHLVASFLKGSIFLCKL